MDVVDMALAEIELQNLMKLTHPTSTTNSTTEKNSDSDCFQKLEFIMYRHRIMSMIDLINDRSLEWSILLSS